MVIYLLGNTAIGKWI